MFNQYGMLHKSQKKQQTGKYVCCCCYCYYCVVIVIVIGRSGVQGIVVFFNSNPEFLCVAREKKTEKGKKGNKKKGRIRVCGRGNMS